MAASRRGIIAGRAYVILDAVDNTPRVLQRIQNNFLNFANRLQSMGAAMVMQGIAAATPGAISLKIFSDFDDAMRRVEARSAGTADELRAVREQAMHLGRTTAFTARMIANLQSILAQRGFSRKQIMEMTPHVMGLARAGGTGNREQDILASADLVSAGIRAFNIEANRSQHVADLFTAAVNNSNFSLEDLIISMGNAGPIANRFNSGITGMAEALASLAAMRNVAVDPSIAGTGFRNLLLKASDVKRRAEFNRELSKATGKTIEFVDAHGNLRRIPDILFSIQDAMQGLGTAQAGALLANLFGLRAITPAGALSNAREDFERMMKAFEMAGGLALRTSKKMDAGIGGSFRILISATEGMALALGDALAPAIMTVNDVLIKLQTTATQWMRKNKELAVALITSIAGYILLGASLVGLAIAIKIVAFSLTPLIMLFSLVATVIKVAMAVVATFAGLLSSLLGITVVATAALVAWFMATLTLSNRTKGAVLHMGESFMTVLKGIGAALRAGQIKLAWAIMIEGMKLMWIEFKNYILNTWDSLVTAMKTRALEIANFWRDVIDDIWGGIDQDASIARFQRMQAKIDAMEARDAERARGRRDQQLLQQIRLQAHLDAIDPSKDVVEDMRRRMADALEGLHRIDEVIMSDQNLVRPGTGLRIPTAMKGMEAKTGKGIEQFYKNLENAQKQGNNIQQQQLGALTQIEENTRGTAITGSSEPMVAV